MALKIFVTGTDTDVGKTFISIGLIKKFNKLGLTTIGMKPIASGCKRVDRKLQNDDAIALQNAASIKLPYDQINPFAFEPAIAPHIASHKAKIRLNVSVLNKKCSTALNCPADIHIVEGVGGWYVPLSLNETMADFVISMNLSVILVVGIRLGGLNHAILTYEAIKKSGLRLAGWVANCIDPKTHEIETNIKTLFGWLDFPCLGIMPYKTAPEKELDVEPLFHDCCITR